MTIDEKINELKSLNGNLCDLESEYKNAQLIKWLEEYKQLKALQIKRPTELYAIENMTTGEIIFNARGGCYREKEAVKRKVKELGTNNYRIVKYRLTCEMF